MFTKRHYETLAYLIKVSDGLEDFKALLEDFLAKDSELFNRGKFRKASEKPSIDYITEALRFSEVRK